MNAEGVVGIIGGAGWLGRAIAVRGLQAGVLGQASLVISSRSPRGDRFSNWPGIVWTTDNHELARRADIVVLSVRPEQFRQISLDLKGRTVISVMAGVSLDTLGHRLNTDRIIRCMPNAAAESGQSFTPWFAGPGVTDGDRAFVGALMGSCGQVAEVDTEDQINYLTGLSGSGPAFPALLASAMLSHATARGLAPHIAKEAVKGVMYAAASFFGTDDFDPAKTVETFVDYQGTTAAGLEEMMRSGFIGSVHAGLQAAEAAAVRMATENQ